MKRISESEEEKVLAKLDKELKVAISDKAKHTLNNNAIKEIYKSEKCKSCSHTVSILTDGMCCYCHICINN